MEYQILSSNENLVDEIINFFTAQETNLECFNLIQEVCLSNSKKFNKPNGETFIKMGFLSSFDFLMYMSHMNKVGNGIKTRFLDIALEQLVKNYIIVPLSSSLGNNSDVRYKPSGQYAKDMYDRNLIKNLLYGFNYIIDSYKNSVVKIEHINIQQDSSIGTGFLVSEKVNNRNLIVTNKHVVEKHSKLRIYSHDDQEIKIHDIFEDDERDIAIIEIEEYGSRPFFLSENLQVMKEIITIGYPTIPTTKYAYQVYHKGEVNSFVENYWNNKLFLISAKTSSGNSGSPIIDNTGMVVGIIAEELFEKDKFYEKGKLPYYAGIPTIEIIQSIEKYKNSIRKG